MSRTAAHLIAYVVALTGGDAVTNWPMGGAALLIGLLAGRDQRSLYILGRVVNRAASGYRGEGKTDARDAAVIADQALMRRDLHPIRPRDENATELRLLAGRRADLVHDRTRTISRLRESLTSIFPGLERSPDVAYTGPLVLLIGYRTVLRWVDQSRLENSSRHRKVRGGTDLASKRIQAAHVQHTTLPAEALTAEFIATLAREVIALNEQVRDTDELIEGRFRRNRQAELVTSLSGIGTLVGAEFVAARGGELTAFAIADRLVGFAGLVPAPCDCGRIGGDLRRPQRYHRGLQRVFAPRR